jgi:hypothetical protein
MRNSAEPDERRPLEPLNDDLLLRPIVDVASRPRVRQPEVARLEDPAL